MGGRTLCRLPECRNSLDVLVDGDGEAVLHLVVLHKEEGVIVEIAEDW